MAAESGVVTVFCEGRPATRSFGSDRSRCLVRTPPSCRPVHLVYFPLRDVGGRPVLRIMASAPPRPGTAEGQPVEEAGDAALASGALWSHNHALCEPQPLALASGGLDAASSPSPSRRWPSTPSTSIPAVLALRTARRSRPRPARSAPWSAEVDARSAVFDRFVRFLIQGDVARGEVYPLSVSAERTQQAISVVRVARAIGADAVARGSTGAGNDPCTSTWPCGCSRRSRDRHPDPRRRGHARPGHRLHRSQASRARQGQRLFHQPGPVGTTWGGGWTPERLGRPARQLLFEPTGAARVPPRVVLGWALRVLPVALDGADAGEALRWWSA